MSADRYTLDDLECDINNLAELLDIVVDIQQAADHSSRDPEQRRGDAIAWVARDLAQTICRHVAAGIVTRDGGGQS